MLIDIARPEDLFHTAIGTAFADIMIDGHRETWPIRSKRFRAFLRRCYYQATGEAASAAEIRSALDLLEARAQFDGPERIVHIRTAEHAGHIYLDLADEHWRAVDIGPDGWRVIECPPVRFRRPAGMLPLPVPERGGSIETLNSFLNLASRNDFVLIVAWLLAALRPGGPYPLLAISGEQGSAKTVLSKLLKALIDPNAAPVRSLSREERELMIAANNGYLLAFDNLSGLPHWLSDALCRLATGGSFAVRRLYTDDEEVLFEAARPILLNGIEEVISRPDLGDRAIFLTLAPIAEADRRPEAELWREFEIARPRILGALLDAVVHGLRTHAIRVQPRSAAAHGRFRALGRGLRASALACRHLRSRLRGKPQSRNREHHRSRSHSHLRARNHGRPDHVDRERVRPSAFMRGECSRDDICEGHALGKKPAGARRPAAAGADVPADARASRFRFSREGRMGTRMIRVSTSTENTVSTVSIVGAARRNGSHRDQPGLAGVSE